MLRYVITQNIILIFQPDVRTEGLSFRLRANVCRGPGDSPTATSYICGVGRKNSPISGDNTKPQSLETTLRQWGLENETEKLKETLKKGSENLLRKIIEHENRLDDEERGNIGAQTDVIGKYKYIAGIPVNPISKIKTLLL